MVGGQGLEVFTMLQKDMLFSEYMPKVLKVALKLKWQEMTWEKAVMYAMNINTSSDRLRNLGIAYHTAEDRAGKTNVILALKEYQRIDFWKFQINLKADHKIASLEM